MEFFINVFTPPAFREDDLPTIHAEMRKIQLATLVPVPLAGFK
jgi:hypothetical protein